MNSLSDSQKSILALVGLGAVAGFLIWRSQKSNSKHAKLQEKLYDPIEEEGPEAYQEANYSKPFLLSNVSLKQDQKIIEQTFFSSDMPNLKTCLKLLHMNHKFYPTYNGYLSNHLPMALVALQKLDGLLPAPPRPAPCEHSYYSF